MQGQPQFCLFESGEVPPPQQEAQDLLVPSLPQSPSSPRYHSGISQAQWVTELGHWALLARAVINPPVWLSVSVPLCLCLCVCLSAPMSAGKVTGGQAPHRPDAVLLTVPTAGPGSEEQAGRRRRSTSSDRASLRGDLVTVKEKE